MRRRIAPLNILAILIIVSAPFLSGCGGGKNTTEADLAVTTTPASGSTQAPAVGPTFSLNVTITSPMPAQGVTIAIKATPDGSNTAFFQKSTSTTAKSNDFTISGQQVAQVNVVYITVTSNSKSSNTWSGSYRYSAK